MHKNRHKYKAKRRQAITTIKESKEFYAKQMLDMSIELTMMCEIKFRKQKPVLESTTQTTRKNLFFQTKSAILLPIIILTFYMLNCE